MLNSNPKSIKENENKKKKLNYFGLMISLLFVAAMVSEDCLGTDRSSSTSGCGVVSLKVAAIGCNGDGVGIVRLRQATVMTAAPWHGHLSRDNQRQDK